MSTVALTAQESADSTRIHCLNEVVVTGSNNAVGRNFLPYTVSTISSEQLEATGKTQLLAAVSGMVPGLFVSQRNIFGFGVSTSGSGGIKIRGVGGSPTNAVLMMVDGQPQFAGIYSHHVADFYETENVERVEVLRGPASVLYGSNAMGGVINLITKNASEQGIRTTLTSQYGSYNTWLTSLTNTVRHGRFLSLVSLGYNRTDGLKDNFDFKQLNAYAKVGYDISDNWSVKADYSFMQFKGNDPIYATLSNPESTDIYRQNVIRGEASATLVNTYSPTNGALRVYYSYGNHFICDPRYFHSLDDRFGVIVYQNFKPWHGADATLGFDFDRYTGKIPVSGGVAHTEGSVSTMNRKAISEYSPYLTLSQKLWTDRLVLNAGLRIANSSSFATQWVPQAGIVLHPGMEWSIKASVAKGYRNPSFRELYLYPPSNPDLEPENMFNYEVTIGKIFNRYLSFDITAYYSKGSDMIQTLQGKNVNTGSFVNKGLEVTMQSHPHDKVQLRATYSYLHTSLANLVAAPKNQYYLSVAWDAFKHFRAEAELKGAGGLFVASDTAHVSYATLDLHLSYQVLRQLGLFAHINNITNTSYTIISGYKMPGINIMGGFKFSI